MKTWLEQLAEANTIEKSQIAIQAGLLKQLEGPALESEYCRDLLTARIQRAINQQRHLVQKHVDQLLANTLRLQIYCQTYLQNRPLETACDCLAHELVRQKGLHESHYQNEMDDAALHRIRNQAERQVSLQSHALAHVRQQMQLKKTLMKLYINLFNEERSLWDKYYLLSPTDKEKKQALLRSVLEEKSKAPSFPGLRFYLKDQINALEQGKAISEQEIVSSVHKQFRELRKQVRDGLKEFDKKRSKRSMWRECIFDACKKLFNAGPLSTKGMLKQAKSMLDKAHTQLSRLDMSHKNQTIKQKQKNKSA